MKKPFPILGALLLLSVANAEQTPKKLDPKNFPYVQAIQKVAPAVVSVEGLTTPGAVVAPGVVQRLQLQTGASGFIVTKQGHIITTYEITKALKDIQVTLTDGRRFKAQKVYEDRWNNFSILQLEGKGPFTPVTFGDAQALRPGESVLAVGFPLAEGLTATAGVVSSLRNFYLLTDYMVPYAIQTDATYYSFNLGGPLINTRGEVVGMNTFSAESYLFFLPVISEQILRQMQNVNFALPANIIQEYLPGILAGEKVFHPWSGIHVVEVSQFLRYYVGFPPEWIDRDVGVIVDNVDAKGPAGKKGVQLGDVILGAKVYLATGERTLKEELVFRSPVDYAATIAKMKKGERIRLSIIRGGKPMEVEFEPFEKPPDAFPGTV
ncbi:MAG: S1C family serine protease [bacterium JZ-2024 1]